MAMLEGRFAGVADRVPLCIQRFSYAASLDYRNRLVGNVGERNVIRIVQ